MPEKHMRLAEQLMETCYHMYADQPTHLAPEIAYFNYNEVGVLRLFFVVEFLVCIFGWYEIVIIPPFNF